MSFYGDRFIFDGIPCEEFGLMLYDIGSTGQQPTSFASNSDFMEDRMTGDRKGLLLTEDESAQYLKSAPTCILVYTTNTLSSNGVVFALSTADFSAYKTVADAGAQNETGAYIAPVFNDVGRGLLQLTDAVGATFAETSYTALVVGGGVWT